MRDGPIGAAAFNNEFGRSRLVWLLPQFRTPTADASLWRAYDKPIMWRVVLESIEPSQVEKRRLRPGDAVVVLGGPGMLIGLGGGAASSLSAGQSSEAAGFCLGAARQPGDAAPLSGSD
jgi:phosphoribosylformylglycinamidine synthase